MPGFTTENAKFIMPLQEKMSYGNSFDRCDSLDSNIIHWTWFDLTNNRGNLRKLDNWDIWNKNIIYIYPQDFFLIIQNETRLNPY